MVMEANNQGSCRKIMRKLLLVNADDPRRLRNQQQLFWIGLKSPSKRSNNATRFRNDINNIPTLFIQLRLFVRIQMEKLQMKSMFPNLQNIKDATWVVVWEKSSKFSSKTFDYYPSCLSQKTSNFCGQVNNIRQSSVHFNESKRFFLLLAWKLSFQFKLSGHVWSIDSKTSLIWFS